MKNFFLSAIFIASIVSADEYTIYVNSHTTSEVTEKRWQPTIEFLNEKISKHTFKLLPIAPTEIEKIKTLLDKEEIDFLITQPAIFSELKYSKGINRVLTMTNDFGMNKFGSVIITHKESGIENISDIKDKNVAAVAPLGFGGWLVAYNEMYDKGIDPLKDKKVHFTGSQHKVVNSVLEKKFDVGVIKTGMLENLSRNHHLDISNIKIINEIPSEYPLKMSTPLYAEWTFAIAKHIKDDELKNKIFKAMNSISKDSQAAVSGRYQGWGLPQNYNNVDEILKKFKLAHYKDMKNYTHNDIIKITLLILLLATFIILYLKYSMSMQMQRRLKKEIENLDKQVQKQTQQIIQQSKLAQMGEMFSMIAHQWRQPLASVAAISGTLSLNLELDKYKKEYFKDQLDSISNLIQHLSRTIDDFRNFYKQNNEAVHTTTNLIIQKVLNLIESSLNDIDIEVINDNDTNEKIEVYENELIQVILNILKNTQDNFIEKNIVNPQIKLTLTSNSICICDNGGGIDEDIIEKIYDPYFSTKKDLNGTGLGLYMSKTIVEDHHNGKLTAKNIDDGVCFTIELGTVLKKLS